MKKRYKNSSGDILIRTTDNCGIVEIMHLWDKQRDYGCVIGYWEKTKSDGEYIAEFRSVGSRIMEVEYDDPTVLLEILKYGQKLADVVIESDLSPEINKSKLSKTMFPDW